MIRARRARGALGAVAARRDGARRAECRGDGAGCARGAGRASQALRRVREVGGTGEGSGRARQRRRATLWAVAASLARRRDNGRWGAAQLALRAQASAERAELQARVGRTHLWRVQRRQLSEAASLREDTA
eukprot:4869483-Prymnesium_polylepis.4